MSPTRLQAEYNQAITNCDLFVSLFHTKVGRYTEEEFRKAHETFTTHGKPLIYTYFKNEDLPNNIPINDLVSLRNFQQQLSDLGHFYTRHDDVNDLKHKFNEQLFKLLPQFTADENDEL